jgi:hypothetical protein
MFEELTDALIEALLTVCPRVYQGWAYKAKLPYIAWDFDGDGDEFRVDSGRVKYETFPGYIDYFTGGDSNPMWIDMRNALNAVCDKYPSRFTWGKTTKEISEPEKAGESSIDHLEWWFRMEV